MCEMLMITGSCLCGNVSYEISGEVGDIVHCHCVTCRKAHGAAFRLFRYGF
ncbi:GFA family protein [Neptunomonas phycophila]|uniref:GFA family protein n=1 Tax=Neptunomonas phycophila TaxID=1572645 RepID=UPI003F636537